MTGLVLSAAAIFLQMEWHRSAMAQTIAVATPDGGVNESLEPASAVSGSPLVGLALGAQKAGSLDFDDIRLLVPENAEGRQRICVRSTTRDGRYTSNTPYIVETAGTVVRLTPATRIPEKLVHYEGPDFAVRAFLGTSQDCSPAGKLNLPMLERGSDDSTLLVTANGKSRSGEARLETKSGVLLSTTHCTVPSGSALIAFDLLCRLDRSGFDEGGAAVLVLSFDDGFDQESYRYDVLLPKVR